jgi:outer membrane protein OmpA-like peptidoglycan-associated protein
VAKLNAELEDAQDKLKGTEDELNEAKGKLANATGDLCRAVDLAQRRKDLAKRIHNNFKDNDVSAIVNADTGDVILDFGEDYFDTDSHKLKDGMERTIRKAIPVYAQSLFGSDVLASLISSVEIIGFASPTYGGKPVDPGGLSLENRTAVNYNLDLSYKRARSIFEYVFNVDKIKFDYQDTMVPLINVTGRSFFAEKIDSDFIDNLTIDQFCAQYNCKKSQRVIIKFGLSHKGETS